LTDCLIDRICGDGDGNHRQRDARGANSIGLVVVSSPGPGFRRCIVSVSDSQRVLFRSVGLLAQLTCEP
jgi:hypothetical protein